ncbi:hypothetical protein [Bradyrhizobium canariense]|uniref:hypothetical protein n=1 Tax=Bradyrhizobium canariense TaxID=255045 RepID=UPI0011780442|nr:hypothetical protein [Bradyrhizobium canariense]
MIIADQSHQQSWRGGGLGAYQLFRSSASPVVALWDQRRCSRDRCPGFECRKMMAALQLRRSAAVNVGSMTEGELKTIREGIISTQVHLKRLAKTLLAIKDRVFE